MQCHNHGVDSVRQPNSMHEQSLPAPSTVCTHVAHPVSMSSGWAFVPEALLHQIFAHLDSADILAANSTCKHWCIMSQPCRVTVQLPPCEGPPDAAQFAAAWRVRTTAASTLHSLKDCASLDISLCIKSNRVQPAWLAPAPPTSSALPQTAVQLLSNVPSHVVRLRLSSVFVGNQQLSSTLPRLQSLRHLSLTVTPGMLAHLAQLRKELVSLPLLALELAAAHPLRHTHGMCPRNCFSTGSPLSTLAHLPCLPTTLNTLTLRALPLGPTLLPALFPTLPALESLQLPMCHVDLTQLPARYFPGRLRAFSVAEATAGLAYRQLTALGSSNWLQRVCLRDARLFDAVACGVEYLSFSLRRWKFSGTQLQHVDLRLHPGSCNSSYPLAMYCNGPLGELFGRTYSPLTHHCTVHVASSLTTVAVDSAQLVMHPCTGSRVCPNPLDRRCNKGYANAVVAAESAADGRSGTQSRQCVGSVATQQAVEHCEQQEQGMGQWAAWQGLGEAAGEPSVTFRGLFSQLASSSLLQRTRLQSVELRLATSQVPAAFQLLHGRTCELHLSCSSPDTYLHLTPSLHALKHAPLRTLSLQGFMVQHVNLSHCQDLQHLTISVPHTQHLHRSFSSSSLRSCNSLRELGPECKHARQDLAVARSSSSVSSDGGYSSDSRTEEDEVPLDDGADISSPFAEQGVAAGMQGRQQSVLSNLCTLDSAESLPTWPAGFSAMGTDNSMAVTEAAEVPQVVLPASLTVLKLEGPVPCITMQGGLQGPQPLRSNSGRNLSAQLKGTREGNGPLAVATNEGPLTWDLSGMWRLQQLDLADGQRKPVAVLRLPGCLRELALRDPWGSVMLSMWAPRLRQLQRLTLNPLDAHMTVRDSIRTLPCLQTLNWC